MVTSQPLLPHTRTIAITSQLIVLPPIFLGFSSSCCCHQASHAHLPFTSHDSPVEKLLVTPHWLPDRIQIHDLRLQGHYILASINISNHLPETTHTSKPYSSHASCPWPSPRPSSGHFPMGNGDVPTSICSPGYVISELKLEVWLGWSKTIILLFKFFLIKKNFFFPHAAHSTWDLSSLARETTRTSCGGRWSPNHWTTREAPFLYLTNIY